ncbi:hypothetical protein [uncultured Psychroserpens sp.]|uniref:hypothetical protein n=1 Tax=uncultured Psychroserpens sp. TaxID=255436 RepID=UPI00262F195B|nr:hypothetical protein [uncultured Psychroserpens sp.]
MKFKLILLALSMMLFNCKKKQEQLNFKYANLNAEINCGNSYDALLNEALHAFESDLTNFYTPNNTNLNSAYRRFVNESTRNTANLNGIANQHSIDIFNTLKDVDGLWDAKNNKMNYSHEIFSCIGNNINAVDIKTTYNALISTNSMSLRMFEAPLKKYSRILQTEKYLATFVALDLYYSKLTNVDLTKKDELKKEQNTIANPEKDPHAGHNHD